VPKIPAACSIPAAGIAITADWEESEHSANAAAPAPRQIKDLDFIVVLPFDGIDRGFSSPHPQFAKPLHPDVLNSLWRSPHGSRPRMTQRKPTWLGDVSIVPRGANANGLLQRLKAIAVFWRAADIQSIARYP
jgi:hypothetical protein